MTMFGISFLGSGGAYGTFETLPSFTNLGYAAFLLGSSLTSTPATNVYDGSTAGNAVINGSPGTIGFTGSGALMTGSASGGVLTITTFTSGLSLAVGDTIYNANGGFVGTIASLGTGTGGTGTYNLAAGYANASSGTLYSVRNRIDLPGFTTSIYNGAVFTADITAGVLTVSTFTSGSALAVGDAIYSGGGLVIGVIASLGTGTGGTGTYNLASGWVATASTTMYRGKTGGIGGLTLFSVAKVAGSGMGEGLVSDYVNNSSASASLLTSNSTNQLLAVAGTTTTANSAVTLPANFGTQWALYVATFSATQVQASYWRTSTGLVQGTATNLPTGTLGSTNKTLQVGRPFTSVPGATTAAVGVYQGALTNAQIVQLGTTLSGMLADFSETL